MNILDIIILVILAASLLRGFQLGLIRQSIHFIGFFISLYAAYHFAGDLAPVLREYIPMPSFDPSTFSLLIKKIQFEVLYYNAIAFVIIFFITKILLHIVGAILHQIARLPVLKTINRFAGAIIGLVQASLLVIIMLHVLTIMPWPTLQTYIDSSLLAEYIMNLTPVVKEKLYQLWGISSQI